MTKPENESTAPELYAPQYDITAEVEERRRQVVQQQYVQLAFTLLVENVRAAGGSNAEDVCDEIDTLYERSKEVDL